MIKVFIKFLRESGNVLTFFKIITSNFFKSNVKWASLYALISGSYNYGIYKRNLEIIKFLNVFI